MKRATASDRDISDTLARKAVQNGWEVKRKTSTYFTATRILDGRLVSIGSSVRDGELIASRSEVTDHTPFTGVVEAWFEGRTP